MDAGGIEFRGISDPNLVDLGYVHTVDTATAFAIGKGGVILEYDVTDWDLGILGFHVLRQDPQSGEYIRLNKQLLPGLVYSRLGGTYGFLD